VDPDRVTPARPARRRLALAAVALATVALLTACSDNEQDTPAISGESPGVVTVPTTPPTTAAPSTTVAGEDLVATAAAAGDFTTLTAALEAAGLVETLQGEGPFTVFAPTDAAFDAALEELGLTAEELLADTETLTSILTYHVVEGEYLAADVAGLDGQEVETVNGAPVTITVDGETVLVNDATVTSADVTASNGVIHVIDQVLLPPTT